MTLPHTRNITRAFLVLSIISFILPAEPLRGQHKTDRSADSPVYVDEKGVMRYSKSDQPVRLFGVNYSVPFAHEFRTLRRLGYDHKKQIKRDVYHMARMGVDAFRMHIWDTEISDSLGNLLNNKHLELLDYLVYQLKQHDIKFILTPLTFYDNGYPEPPTPTPGFANYISKSEASVNQEYWPVIKRYLRQFINHKNPFTGLTYREDPDFIALEIVNEPAHEEIDSTRLFVNTMADHLRSEGWDKPIFYNISQNPSVAGGVMSANIDGVSFQWYPAGLVSGSSIQKNYLPYIDRYPIPFSNKPGFQSKAQMVYEFSPADVPYSYPYVVMARSFRQAGFQFATQFAYDALAMGNINTAYRTHYLNLAYTPSKAVGFRIAAAAFHHLPRGITPKSFPADTVFGDGAFKVSHSADRAIMNTDTAFFYSGSTREKPRDVSRLKHIMGVGSSPVVQYSGTGAYFLDRLREGVWRLELMPDAVSFFDPFDVTAYIKSLVRIHWANREMTLNLPDLGDDFRVRGINKKNNVDKKVQNGSFTISPGTYLVTSTSELSASALPDTLKRGIPLKEFVAPPPSPGSPQIRHHPRPVARVADPVEIEATAAGITAGDSLYVFVDQDGEAEKIPMQKKGPYKYKATIPADLLDTGFLTYWMVVDRGDSSLTFPGAHPGTPDDWDYFYEDQWKTRVTGSSAPLVLFQSDKHHDEINYAFRFWDSEHRVDRVSTPRPGRMATKIEAAGPVEEGRALGWGYSFAGRNLQKSIDNQSADSLGVRIKAASKETNKVKLILVTDQGAGFSRIIDPDSRFESKYIALEDFENDAFMLLPRPYPVFLPLWFNGARPRELKAKQIEQIQFQLVTGDKPVTKGMGFSVETVWLQ